MERAHTACGFCGARITTGPWFKTYCSQLCRVKAYQKRERERAKAWREASRAGGVTGRDGHA